MHAVTFEETVDRVRRALAERPAAALEVPGFRPAAVLVPLLDRPTGPTLLFTRRTDRVPSHKGEISFPGGAREPGEDAVRAALREADEEVGLPTEAVEPLGALDDVPSIARFVVTPVVAAIRAPPARFRTAEFEVHEPFELPLASLRDPAQRTSSLARSVARTLRCAVHSSPSRSRSSPDVPRARSRLARSSSVQFPARRRCASRCC